MPLKQGLSLPVRYDFILFGSSGSAHDVAVVIRQDAMFHSRDYKNQPSSHKLVNASATCFRRSPFETQQSLLVSVASRATGLRCPSLPSLHVGQSHPSSTKDCDRASNMVDTRAHTSAGDSLSSSSPSIRSGAPAFGARSCRSDSSTSSQMQSNK